MSKCEISWGLPDQIASGHCCMGVDYKRQKYLKGTLLPFDGQPPPLEDQPKLAEPLSKASSKQGGLTPRKMSPCKRKLIPRLLPSQQCVILLWMSWMYPFRNQHHRLCTPMRDQLMHQHQVQRGTMSLSHPQRVIQIPFSLWIKGMQSQHRLSDWQTYLHDNFLSRFVIRLILLLAI